MSIPKEKLIIQEIKDIMAGIDLFGWTDNLDELIRIKELVNSYEDPGYITGPIVGIPDGPES